MVYISIKHFFFSFPCEYLLFPHNLGSVSVGIIIAPGSTFNIHCFYSLLVPSCSLFCLIGLTCYLSYSYEFFKFLDLTYFFPWHVLLFGFHIYHVPVEAHLSTKQDSDISSQNQNIPEVSFSFLFPLHPPLFWFYLLTPEL